ADTYVALKQPDKALQAYERTLQIDRRDIFSHLRAGSLFLMGGDFNRAASHATDALAIDARNIDEHILLANAKAGLRELRGGLTQLEGAVAINPSGWSGYSALGQLRWLDGDRAA